MRLRLALFGTLLLTVPLHAGDLAKIYAATLDHHEGQLGREWTSSSADVWQLDSFHFDSQGKLDITLGPSVVVFGVTQKNVVWAALFPDKPAKIKSKAGGDGELVTNIWMRFNPAHVGDLFPAKTVGKNGPEDQIAWAKRMAAWKIGDDWQANNLPIIPKRNLILLDCETAAGARRHFVVEKDRGTVTLDADFEKRTLPALVPMEKSAALSAFDNVWSAFDKEYAKFQLVPKVDWKKSGDEWRKRAEKATTTFGVAAVLDALVSQLHDVNAWVKHGDALLQGYTRPRPLNGSFNAIAKAIKITDTRHDVRYGRTDDGIGYVVVIDLSDKEVTKSFDQALDALADCWALVVDLRFNGGSEDVPAREIASRFADQSRVYGSNQERNGPKHEDLAPKVERTFEPRGPWRFESPVVCLQGQKTFNSGESMALMLAQCPQVTTMGDRTGGSSGNPRLIELEGGIKVNLPRGNEMDTSGNSIDVAGIAPRVKLTPEAGYFDDAKDPIWDAALELLRKTAAADRKPGKRG